MQTTIPCTIMRGGTSKGLFFREEDLPSDLSRRQDAILKAFGSPDPSGRQIDGLGGATSTTSKVAIIGKRKNETNGINYTFGQVDIKTPLIDMKGNCGNLSSAVGPFAIDAGLVDVIHEPYTKVHIYNTNTKKYITSHVPVKNGQTLYEGHFTIPGVTNKGSQIELHFLEPGGAVTGSLLPTGQTRDVLETASHGSFEVSIIDAANPVVFVRANDLRLLGKELPKDIDESEALRNKILDIRAAAAIKIGLAKDFEDAHVNNPAVPKVSFISKPQDYQTMENTQISKADIHIVARMMSMGKLHPTFAITGGICLGIASKIQGTIVHEFVNNDDDNIKIGHCSGIFEVGAEVIRKGNDFAAVRGIVFRTARSLMKGEVNIVY